jgi:hypothetical protein
MKILDFFKRFPDENSCKSAFKACREQTGVICKKCQGTEHYWLNSKEMYECKSCHFRMSLKSGTVMEKSKLPYQYWFIALHLLTATKKTVSALEVQRQIGHKYYEPIWAMMHKIRRSMSQRDERYQLGPDVELDEGFYSTAFTLGIDEFTGNQEELKRGKGSQKKAKVLVMASFDRVSPEDFNPKKYRTHSKVKYIKMKVVEDLEATTVNREVKSTINTNSTVHTDDYTSYKKLSEVIQKHNAYNLQYDESDKVLPWVHKAITNSKNLLKAIHHCVWPDYLQNYLDEFCYKHNRRYFGTNVFDRSLIAAVSNTWY